MYRNPAPHETTHRNDNAVVCVIPTLTSWREGSHVAGLDPLLPLASGRYCQTVRATRMPESVHRVQFVSLLLADNTLWSTCEPQSDQNYPAESVPAIFKIKNVITKRWAEKAINSDRHHRHSSKPQPSEVPVKVQHMDGAAFCHRRDCQVVAYDAYEAV